MILALAAELSEADPFAPMERARSLGRILPPRLDRSGLEALFDTAVFTGQPGSGGGEGDEPGQPDGDPWIERYVMHADQLDLAGLLRRLPLNR